MCVDKAYLTLMFFWNLAFDRGISKSYNYSASWSTENAALQTKFPNAERWRMVKDWCLGEVSWLGVGWSGTQVHLCARVWKGVRAWVGAHVCACMHMRVECVCACVHVWVWECVWVSWWRRGKRFISSSAHNPVCFLLAEKVLFAQSKISEC